MLTALAFSTREPQVLQVLLSWTVRLAELVQKFALHVPDLVSQDEHCAFLFPEEVSVEE